MAKRKCPDNDISQELSNLKVEFPVFRVSFQAPGDVTAKGTLASTWEGLIWYYDEQHLTADICS